jgi:hypothetical protein
MVHGIIKLELGGKQRVAQFNQYALIHAATILKCDPLEIPFFLEKMIKTNMARVLNILVFSAIMGYNEKEADYDNDVTLKEVAGWIHDCDANTLTPLWASFLEASQMSDVLSKQVKDISEDSEKKK